MSISQIVAVCAVTGAFIIFAAVLAWGDFQTRNLPPNGRKQVQPNEPGAGFMALKDAAAKAAKSSDRPARDATAPSSRAERSA